jgi:hypothetical protein
MPAKTLRPPRGCALSSRRPILEPARYAEPLTTRDCRTVAKAAAKPRPLVSAEGVAQCDVGSVLKDAGRAGLLAAARGCWRVGRYPNQGRAASRSRSHSGASWFASQPSWRQGSDASTDHQTARRGSRIAIAIRGVVRLVEGVRFRSLERGRRRARGRESGFLRFQRIRRWFPCRDRLQAVRGLG